MKDIAQKQLQNRTFISERLKHALEDCTHKTMSIVNAPTGYGKTVAVRTLCANLDMPVLWVNIYDGNPQHVWDSFCNILFENKAVENRLAKWPFPTEGMQKDAFLKEFRKVLEHGPVMIVFDDYHLIQSRQIGEFFQLLCRENAAKFHLIIISQKQFFEGEDIAFATGKINKISTEDLKLSREDIPEYLALFSIDINEINHKEELIQLYDRSEGWISMIYISVLEYLRTGRSNPTADMEHLVNQVAYKTCSKDTQLFLLNLFEMQDFSKEQADFFNDGNDSSVYLQELYENLAFITYDKETQLYHIHTIFMNCIKKQFDKLSMFEKCSRYEKLADYYISIGDYDKALFWYEKAGNYEGILRTIELYETICSESEDYSLFVKSFDHCPEALFEDYPLSIILYMWRFYNNGDDERLNRCMTLFEDTMKHIKFAKEDCEYLWQAYYFFLSQNAFNNLEEMSYYMQRAFEYSKSDMPKINPYIPRNFGLTSVFHAFYVDGSADKTIEELQKYIDELHRHAIFSLDGIVELAKAEKCYLEGDFEQAELICHTALRMFKNQNMICYEIALYNLLAQIAYTYGDKDTIIRYINTMRERVLQNGRDNSPVALAVDMCEAYFHVNIGYPQYMASWLEDLEDNPGYLMPQAKPYSYIFRGALGLYRERYKYILSAKGMMLSSLKERHSNLTEGTMYLVFASAAASLGKIEEAKEYIKKCNSLIGFSPVMSYAKYCHWIMQPLQELAEEDERYKDIIVMCRKMSTIRNNMCNGEFIGVFPSLTKRENEIALLVMDGMSNKEISAQLFISENTVKSSLKSIFGKLGISSRRDLIKKLQMGNSFETF